MQTVILQTQDLREVVHQQSVMAEETNGITPSLTDRSSFLPSFLDLLSQRRNQLTQLITVAEQEFNADKSKIQEFYSLARKQVDC